MWGKCAGLLEIFFFTLYFKCKTTRGKGVAYTIGKDPYHTNCKRQTNLHFTLSNLSIKVIFLKTKSKKWTILESKNCIVICGEAVLCSILFYGKNIFVNILIKGQILIVSLICNSLSFFYDQKSLAVYAWYQTIWHYALLTIHQNNHQFLLK